MPTSQIAWRQIRRRAVDLALAQVALSLALLMVVAAVLLTADPLPAPVFALLLFPLVAAVYFGFGLLAWVRRPGNSTGAVLCLGAVAWLAAGLLNSEPPALVAVGEVMSQAPMPIVIHLLLVVPSGRLATRSSAALVAAAYGASIVLQAPHYLFAPPSPPYDLLQLADRPDLVQLGKRAQRVASIAVVALTALTVTRRTRRASRSERRVMAPLYACGLIVLMAIPLIALVLEPLFGWSGLTRFVIQATLLGLVPVAFGSTVLLGGFAPTAEVAELGVWLGASADRDRSELRAALARALGDPTLDLAFSVSEAAPAGGDDPQAREGPRCRRGSVVIERGGRPVGVISYDPTVLTDPELVAAAGRVVAIAVDNERLNTELRTNQAALQQSRRRIVEAGDRERRRIERNLHDGAQQRMVSVALALRMAEVQVASSPPHVRGLLAEAADHLDAAVRELRELARGVHPALLTEVGLAAALESLAERSPIPVALRTALPTELPEAIMVGAYYVAAEALTNAAKHSGATSIDVVATVHDGWLHVEVDDDGCGGAVVVRGSGLEGLTDRVDSLGGSLRIASPSSGGTRLTAELPCA